MVKSLSLSFSCPNCNGKGKVSAGIWYDEMEQFLDKFEICPICHGKGIISITGKKCLKGGK